MTTVHVYPNNDLLEHDTDSFNDCACLPKCEAHSGGWVVTHAAWDGRPE